MFGNSVMVSTTSPARSPHATIMTTSAFEYRAINPWRDGLPSSKGTWNAGGPPSCNRKKAVNQANGCCQRFTRIESLNLPLSDHLIGDWSPDGPMLNHSNIALMAFDIFDSRDRCVQGKSTFLNPSDGHGSWLIERHHNLMKKSSLLDGSDHPPRLKGRADFYSRDE